MVDENEELRHALAKISEIQRENQRLEYRLTSGSEMRRFALVGIGLAVFAAGASYWTARHGCERHAVYESATQARLHEERMADERSVEEACLESSKKASTELAACQEQRTRADLNDRFQPRFAPPMPRPPGRL